MKNPCCRPDSRLDYRPSKARNSAIPHLILILSIAISGALISCAGNNYDVLYSQSPDVLGNSLYVSGSFYFDSFEGYGEIYNINFYTESNYGAEFDIAYSDAILTSSNLSTPNLDASQVTSSSLLAGSTLSLYAEDESGGGLFMIEGEGLNEGENKLAELSFVEVTLLTPNGGDYTWVNESSEENIIATYTYGFSEIEGTFSLNLKATSSQAKESEDQP